MQNATFKMHTPDLPRLNARRSAQSGTDDIIRRRGVILHFAFCILHF